MAIEGVKRRAWGDDIFKLAAVGSASLVFVCMGGLLFELIRNSLPSLKAFGFSFLWTQSWNPVKDNYGGLSSIYGTLVSTAIAMLIAVPFSVVLAIFLVKLAPPWMSKPVGYAIELLAAIPSIIYGMWGLFVFAPYMKAHAQPILAGAFGHIPYLRALFAPTPSGVGMLTAGVILALMVLPFICAVMRDVFKMVPAVIEEAAFGLGSTSLEVMRRVTIPYAINGLVGGVFLGLARALGETMAVTFVIGNDHRIAASLFAGGNSIASALANEFAEADGLYLSSLVELGLILFFITFVVQALAQLWLKRLARTSGGR